MLSAIRSYWLSAKWYLWWSNLSIINNQFLASKELLSVNYWLNFGYLAHICKSFSDMKWSLMQTLAPISEKVVSDILNSFRIWLLDIWRLFGYVMTLRLNGLYGVLYGIVVNKMLKCNELNSEIARLHTIPSCKHFAVQWQSEFITSWFILVLYTFKQTNGGLYWGYFDHNSGHVTVDRNQLT